MKLKQLLRRITVLLVVSIVFNLYFVIRLGRLEKQLDQRINQAISEARRTSDDIGSLHYQLRQLKEEQEWLEEADFTLEDVLAKGALLTGTFSFRSATPGAQVALQIRPSKDNARPGQAGRATAMKEDNEWQDVTADRQTELTYKAQLQLSPDKNYEYRLVSRSQDAILASPIKQLPPQIYRRPSLTSQFGWSSNNGNLISANIELTYPYEPPQFPAFKAVSATLEIIQEHGVVKTHEFAASTYHEKVPFILEDLTDLPTNAALFAIVQYADGYIMNVHIGSTDRQGFPSY